MNSYDANEQAYKNGYEKGYAEAKAKFEPIKAKKITIFDLEECGMKTNYFGRFPFLEALILSRYKTITNFCKDTNCSRYAVGDYFLGKVNPSYEFICKCLAIFKNYSFEELFMEQGTGG